MKFVEINGEKHLKIGNSYYTCETAQMLIRIGENTIKAYHKSSLPETTDSEVKTYAK